MNYCPHCGEKLPIEPAIPKHQELEPWPSPHTITRTAEEQPCLWDSMPETPIGSGMKIGLLACPCPKHSMWC